MFGKPRVNGVPQFYPEANVSAPAPVQTAEVIPAAQQSNGIAPSTNLELARLMPVMDIESAIARRRLIIDATANLMQEGVDYGKSPVPVTAWCCCNRVPTNSASCSAW